MRNFKGFLRDSIRQNSHHPLSDFYTLSGPLATEMIKDNEKRLESVTLTQL